MLKNYLLVSIRSILRHRTFSFINIFGLALSMSVCLFIIMLIRDAYNFDKFHTGHESIYRLITDAERRNGQVESYASSPFPIAQRLAETDPDVELWTPLVRRLRTSTRSGQESIDISGLITDSSFLQMFGFEIAEGDPTYALDDPFSLILTQNLAQVLFPKGNAIGQSLKLNGYENEFKITAILAPFPGKTHMEFDALGSLATISGNENMSGSYIPEDWNDDYSTFNYFKLNKNANTNEIENHLNAIAASIYADLTLESRDAGYSFELQPLDEITPGRKSPELSP